MKASTRSTRAAVAIVAMSLVGGIALAGCSSDSASEAAPSEEATMVEAGSDPAMLALCEQMIADGLTADEATALAEENGYIARVGTIDGEPQAVTMDYRVDRFTFEVADGVVVACQYG